MKKQGNKRQWLPVKIISVISVILFGGVTVCGVLVAAGANPIKPENTEAIEDKADAQTDQENLLLSYNLTDAEDLTTRVCHLCPRI